MEHIMSRERKMNKMNDDTISRQAAIDAIEQHKTSVLGDREWDEGIAYGYAAAHRHFVDIVKQLPSAERRGRWEWNNEDEFFYSCSNCGHKAYGNTAEIVSGLYNYCPNCGARMEE